MSSSRIPEAPCGGGFTLIEVLMVLLILAVLAASLALPLGARVELHRQDETRRHLDEAKETLLGFAAAHGRLPCPASEESRGAESFAPGGDSTNGECSHFHNGLLPAATLGMAGLDEQGYARDAWATRANRIRYAVSGGVVNGIANPFTRVNGLQSATLAGLGAATHHLFVCLDGSLVTASSCGPAANQLTRKAALVLLSLGSNAGSTPGSDEARNLDGDGVFVWRDASNVPGREFDDLLLWVPVHLVAHRLVSAGRLP